MVHELYESPSVRAALEARLGSGALAQDGGVDRAAVARIVFSDPDAREWLEGLLWPLVGERIASWRAAQERRRPPPRALVVEVPLLFESGADHGFDATIAIIADDAVRARRAHRRGHEAVAERESRQLSQQEKARRATYTVVNDGTRADLATGLSAILSALQR